MGRKSEGWRKERPKGTANKGNRNPEPLKGQRAIREQRGTIRHPSENP